MVVGTPARRPRGIHRAIGARLAANLVWLDALENGRDTRWIVNFYRKRIRHVPSTVRREPCLSLRIRPALGRDFQPQSRVAHFHYRHVRRGLVVVHGRKNDLGKSAALDDFRIGVVVADGYFSGSTAPRCCPTLCAESCALHRHLVYCHLENVAAMEHRKSFERLTGINPYLQVRLVPSRRPC